MKKNSYTSTIKNIFIRFLLVGLFFGSANILFNRCAADPDDPGFCELDCSATKIASDDFSVEFIGFPEGEAQTLACLGTASGQPYFKQVPIRFSFKKPYNKPTSSVFNRDTADSEEGQPTQPISNISYEVSVVSGQGGQNAEDDPDGDNAGIVTSQGEWCTDSCGVGSINVVPTCYSEEYEFSIMVRSGNVGKTIKFNITP